MPKGIVPGLIMIAFRKHAGLNDIEDIVQQYPHCQLHGNGKYVLRVRTGDEESVLKKISKRYKEIIKSIRYVYD